MNQAILVMTYGSPEQYTFEGIAQFFTNIRRGKRPSDDEIEHLYNSYKAIDKSPLQQITKNTVELLQKNLNEYKIYFANKFSNPFIQDVIKEMENDGIEKCICLILEPQYSIYSIMGYERFISSSKIKFNLIKEWYNEPKLIDYWVEEIRKIIDQIGDQSYKVIFTAHSVPVIAQEYGDPYIEQVEKMIRIIAEELELSTENYTNAWQSESDIGIPWIKPDVLEYINDKETHEQNYIFAPISFISDHIETLFDNDVECKELCEKYGVNYYRPPMPNCDERFIAALINVIEKNKENEYLYLNGDINTFDEMKSPKNDHELKMPEFVKKLIAKKGKENVKMPEHIRKMLIKAGRIKE